MKLWQTALHKAVDLGLIAVLFVIVFQWLLGKFDRDMEALKTGVAGLTLRTQKIEAEVQELRQQPQVENLRREFGRYISARSVYLDSEEAEQVYHIAFTKDMYEMMNACSEQLNILLANPNVGEDSIYQELCRTLWGLLQETRRFLGKFHVRAGSLAAPLSEKLPLSSPDGSLAGDTVFRNEVRAVAKLICCVDKPPEVRLRDVRSRAFTRLTDSKALVRPHHEAK